MNDQIHQKVGLDLDLRGDQLVPAALEDDRHWLFDVAWSGHVRFVPFSSHHLLALFPTAKAPRLPSIDLCRFS